MKLSAIYRKAAELAAKKRHIPEYILLMLHLNGTDHRSHPDQLKALALFDPAAPPGREGRTFGDTVKLERDAVVLGFLLLAEFEKDEERRAIRGSARCTSAGIFRV